MFFFVADEEGHNSEIDNEFLAIVSEFVSQNPGLATRGSRFVVVSLLTRDVRGLY